MRGSVESGPTTVRTSGSTRRSCESQSCSGGLFTQPTARSTKDTISISERISKAGGDLVSSPPKRSTQPTAAGKWSSRCLRFLAEFERNQISERTTAAMAHMRDQGRFLGQVPFGYDLGPDGETLVVNAVETDIDSSDRRTASARSQPSKDRNTQLETASVRPKAGIRVGPTQRFEASSIVPGHIAGQPHEIPA